MKQFGMRDKMRYAFDNSIAKGTGAMIRWLGLVAFVVILVVAILAHFTLSSDDVTANNPDGIVSDPGIVHLMWMGLMRTLDSGTMGGDTGSIPLLIWMLTFTFTGVFLISTLIGLITSGVEAKIDELRKGRSLVVETNHILILGWSSKIFTVLEQLALANESSAKPRIVILADKDKVEMEDELAGRVGNTGKVKIICRSGNPIDVGDLEMVNPDEARTILIMPPEDDDPDSQVVKIILAILNNPKRKKEKYQIVAELHDRKNIDVVKMISNGEVEMLESPGLIARITVQTCRQSGLSVIYADLLDFGGCEIYFKEEPQLTGKTLGECVMAYEESAILGVRRAAGQVQVLPGLDTLIGAGDQLIMLAEDDSAIKYTGVNEQGVDRQVMREAEAKSVSPEKTLILGWNPRGATIAYELSKYVAPGSKITIFAELGEPEEDLKHEGEMPNVTLDIQKGDTTDRVMLNALDIPSYDHVILLSYSELEIQRADARSLITLLHLRDIAQKSTEKFSIVGEILDVRNRDLAEVTGADDFIVSDKLISLMMAQVAENKDLNAVFEDLFDPEGAEIYLKLASDYVALGQPVNFRTICAVARDRGELVMGYRQLRYANNAEKAYGVVLNPKKSSTETYQEGDRIIVLAED